MDLDIAQSFLAHIFSRPEPKAQVRYLYGNGLLGSTFSVHTLEVVYLQIQLPNLDLISRKTSSGMGIDCIRFLG